VRNADTSKTLHDLRRLTYKQLRQPVSVFNLPTVSQFE
jgi:hypothetical protein